MSTLWAACAAVAVLLATSLDLAAQLVPAVRDAAPTRRGRILEGAAVARLALVVAALFVSLALADVPVVAVGLLGIVPVAFGVAAIRRHGAPGHVAATGWIAAMVLTFTSGGDDVASWLVVLRWQAGHAVWPVAVVLLVGAAIVPWLIGVVARGRLAARAARVLGAVAAPAQIAVGVTLVAISATALR